MTEDEWIDYGDHLYHQTKENMLAPRSEWGPNELANAMLYGTCLECGTPREVRRTEANGVTTMSLVAPCGHGQE